MSCGCQNSTCTCTRRSTCTGGASATTVYVPDQRRTVRVNDDYEAAAGDNVVQVIGNESGNPTVKITLPPNAAGGQAILVTAAADDITIEAAGDDTVAGPATIATGTSTEYTYVAGAEQCDPGQWIPTCCAPEA